MVYQPWWKLLKANICFHTYDHNFGLVIPCPTGISWEQQTQGVMCSHISIEGVFVPLEEPKCLSELPDANYNYDGKGVQKAWRKIRTFLKQNGLEFVRVQAPKDQPDNQEGLQWIRIKKYKNSIMDASSLTGEVVALYYPNCD